jgi:hypothetical protein
MTPVDIYAGRSKMILRKQEGIEHKTRQISRLQNLKNWEVESVCN